MTAEHPASGAPRPIEEVARGLDIRPEHMIGYGADKAKIALEARASGRPDGRLVLVSAITPTSAGEGKTTTAISLAQGLAAVGEHATVVLREPSLGPVFGFKGGATGGGRASLVPDADVNLHFTGDFHAISTANNLLAAALDNHLQQGNALGLDVRRILWRRVVDLNDRALRNVVVGLGGAAQGVPRETGFDITPASEVMAALCLAEDAADLRARLERMVVAQNPDRKPVTAGELKAVGAMMVVLKEAIKPNLVQTTEGVPAFVHGGPFANIAHGCNSVLATKMALAHADWVVTEAGFGFDLGGEKFFDLKCVSAGLQPAAVVLVATIRALKRHGGAADQSLCEPDPAAVERGLANLEKHLENVRLFGHEAVVALNLFADDTAEEVAVVEGLCKRLDVPFALSKGVAEGGPGAAELARMVVSHAAAGARPFTPLYAREDPLAEKIETIARRVYGAGTVTLTGAAQRDLRWLADAGYAALPVCMAKTPMSFSQDPRLAGRPEGFEITVENVILAAGAGFVVPIVGSILRMPGLPKAGQLERIDLVDGEVVGMR